MLQPRKLPDLKVGQRLHWRQLGLQMQQLLLHARWLLMLPQ
jgi:hypothetical protein